MRTADTPGIPHQRRHAKFEARTGPAAVGLESRHARTKYAVQASGLGGHKVVADLIEVHS